MSADGAHRRCPRCNGLGCGATAWPKAGGRTCGTPARQHCKIPPLRVGTDAYDALDLLATALVQWVWTNGSGLTLAPGTTAPPYPTSTEES